MYQRVLPRDLFNEGKLLKCLGQLCLLIHDEKLPLRVEHDTRSNSGFTLSQDPSNGSFYCENLRFYTGKNRRVQVYTGLNARDPYPLTYLKDDLGEEAALDDKGNPTPEFLRSINDA